MCIFAVVVTWNSSSLLSLVRRLVAPSARLQPDLCGRVSVADVKAAQCLRHTDDIAAIAIADGGLERLT